jgi:hypothetical protein
VVGQVARDLGHELRVRVRGDAGVHLPELIALPGQ